MSASVIVMGPWGGTGGLPWTYTSPGGVIREVVIHYGDVIDSLAFAYKDQNGMHYSHTFGGNGGKAVTIPFPQGEYLTNISGTYGEYKGPTVLRSIQFCTNRKTYGPYGIPGAGTKFGIAMKGAEIRGFHGRAAKYIDSIGMIVRPAST